MRPYRINYASGQILPRADADEFNRKLAKQAAPICESHEDIEDMAIELAGHQSEIRFSKFREMLIEAWYAHNVNLICAEFSGTVDGAIGGKQ
jgi:hypothetical protein